MIFILLTFFIALLITRKPMVEMLPEEEIKDYRRTSAFIDLSLAYVVMFNEDINITSVSDCEL